MMMARLSFRTFPFIKDWTIRRKVPKRKTMTDVVLFEPIKR